MARLRWLLLLLAAAGLLAGCGSARDITTDAGSVGVGAAVGAATGNALIGLAVGIGTQIAADEGFKSAERSYYGSIQDAIAAAAGPTAPGDITHWSFDGLLGFGRVSGRVEVVRSFGVHLSCKELIYTVETVAYEPPPRAAPAASRGRPPDVAPPLDDLREAAESQPDPADETEPPEPEIFVTTVCKSGTDWQWAESRPSIERWGGLQ